MDTRTHATNHPSLVSVSREARDGLETVGLRWSLVSKVPNLLGVRDAPGSVARNVDFVIHPIRVIRFLPSNRLDRREPMLGEVFESFGHFVSEAPMRVSDTVTSCPGPSG
jgi:hypothetical protein